MKKKIKTNLQLLHAVLNKCQVCGAVGIVSLQSPFSFNNPAAQCIQLTVENLIVLDSSLGSKAKGKFSEQKICKGCS